MLDRNLLVHHTAAVREVLKTRGEKAVQLLDGFEELNTQRKALITGTETLRARKNVISDEIPKLKKANEPADHLIAESKAIGVQLVEGEKELKRVEAAMDEVLQSIPNLPQGHLERVLVDAMPQEEKDYFRLLYILAGQNAKDEGFEEFEIDSDSLHLPQDMLNRVMSLLIHGDYYDALKRIAVLDAEYERIMAEIEQDGDKA